MVNTIDSTSNLNNSDSSLLDTVTKPLNTYKFVKRKEWYALNDSLLTPASRQILADLNRVDLLHLTRLDSIIVPENLDNERFSYSAFPAVAPALADVNQVIFFSYPTQSFAAYELGKLVLTGPTNMGRRSKPTPTGLFFTNWKAKETISTVNDEWKLKWNFNVANFDGVGFHEYALPGYPASHSCMRLQENDAKFLYTWARQWQLQNGAIKAKGTPVIIFGLYPFGSRKPWLQLAADPKALEITAAALQEVFDPFREAVLKAQAITQQYAAPKEVADTSTVKM